MDSFSEDEWDELLNRIKEGKCTPFIGSAISQKYLQLLQAIAVEWADEYDYPLETDNLASIAQYLSVTKYKRFPKVQMQKRFSSVEATDFLAPDQPHAILADLPFPIYVTSNYDNFIIDAMEKSDRHKSPHRELFRWNSSEPEKDYDPTPIRPLVYHLHGHKDLPESLVLTEDDYLDCLGNISIEKLKSIRLALSSTSLLIIGYRPGDWDFRALFRGFLPKAEKGDRSISVTIQISPTPDEGTREQVQDYLNKYFKGTDQEMYVYWGTAEEFVTELNDRWLRKVAKEGLSDLYENAAKGKDLSKIFNNLTEGFNIEELKVLSFKLDIKYENFPTPISKPNFVREMIEYMVRCDRLPELIEMCKQERPKMDWS